MSYWTRRQEQLKQTAEKDEAKIKKRLSSFYDAEFKRLEKEIAAYYQQYGEDNVISYRNMLQSLSDEDRRLLMERMDEFAKKYPQYANLMPVRESIYKLDRLQGLQYSVYIAEAEIAGYTNEQMTEYLTKLSQKGVNYGMETLGFGTNFYSINSDVVKQFVDVPWCNGENFSTRIWNDTQKLAQYLNQDLAQGFARGDSYDKLVRNLRQRFGRVNRKDAYRLVYTEGTYVMAEATMQPFKDNFEKYRLSPVLDGKTCPICRGLREQVFLISERQPGVNFPPIHPWCRCSWEIVVDDWDAWMDEYVTKHSGDKKQAEKIEERIGASVAKRNTGTPVRYSEKYDYSIKIDGYSDKVLQNFSEYAEDVAKKGSKDGREHMYLINTVTGEKEYYEKGTEGEVGGPEFWAFLESHSNGSYAFIHNHNTDGSFSETDMRTLLQNNNIGPMIAVRNDAVIYVAEKGDNTPATGYYDDLYQDELNKLNADVKNGKISLADRNIRREEIIVDGLLRDYTKAGRLVEINGQK